MSQRVVWVVALSVALVASAAQAANCVSQGKATFTLTGKPTSFVAASDFKMKEVSGSVIVMSNVNPAGLLTGANADPWPNGIFIYFTKPGNCTAQFPSDGGVYIGTTIVNPLVAHVTNGRYCDVTNGTDVRDPLKPRNVISVIYPGNKCPLYSGFADVSNEVIVFDKDNKPFVNRFTANFTVQCTDLLSRDFTDVSGSIDYTATPATSGSKTPNGVKLAIGTSPACTAGQAGSDGSGGGTDNGGGGSGGGTAGTPTNVSLVVPDDISIAPVVMSPDQKVTFDLSTAIANGFSGDVILDAVTDADPTEFLDVNVSPNTIASPGAGTSKVTITTHPLTFPRDYNVTLIATTPFDNAIYYRTFTVTVLCDPPKILGTEQPDDATIHGNGNASVKVKAAGSGPFTYQWYSGMPGMDMFPVKGATGATLTTSEDGLYWVRVSNACGSADSQAATVSKQ